MALWLGRDPLVLASRSAARQALLEASGVAVAVYPADLDERRLEGNAAVTASGEVALMLAREKAAAVASRHRGRLVLGADQTLAFAERRFSKPADRAAAREQLLALRGRTHQLQAAIAFVRDATVLFEHVAVAQLTMRDFSERFLDLYLDAAGEAATASVGAYQIEGLGIQLFERIKGDYFTVLGLPLIETLDYLRRGGYLVP